jgi:hypothetical protein
MTSSNTSSQDTATSANRLSDSGDTQNSTQSESHRSQLSNQETDNFDTALFEYGQSILESTLDDSHDEDQLYEDRIFESKQKVRAQYDSAVDDLKFHLSVSRGENRGLQVSHKRLETEVLRLHQALHDQEASSIKAYKMLGGQCWELDSSRDKEVEKRRKVEAQMIALKEDRERKAEQKAEMWYRAEKRKAE